MAAVSPWRQRNPRLAEGLTLDGFAKQIPERRGEHRTEVASDRPALAASIAAQPQLPADAQILRLVVE